MNTIASAIHTVNGILIRVADLQLGLDAVDISLEDVVDVAIIGDLFTPHVSVSRDVSYELAVVEANDVVQVNNLCVLAVVRLYDVITMSNHGLDIRAGVALPGNVGAGADVVGTNQELSVSSDLDGVLAFNLEDGLALYEGDICIIVVCIVIIRTGQRVLALGVGLELAEQVIDEEERLVVLFAHAKLIMNSSDNVLNSQLVLVGNLIGSRGLHFNSLVITILDGSDNNILSDLRIETNNVGMDGSNALVVLNPNLVENAVLGDIRSVLHADHVAVSVIEEAPGAEVISVLGLVVAEVEVCSVLDVLAANAGFGGIVSNVRILEAVQTAFLRGDNVNGLNAQNSVIFLGVLILLEGVGEQDIIILCKTSGLVVSNIFLTLAGFACELEVATLPGMIVIHIVAVVGIVVLAVQAVIADSGGNDLNQIFALLVVVVRSRGLGDLCELAQPGVDGADTVDSLAVIVLLRKDLRQGALCAVLLILVGLELALACSVLQRDSIVRNEFTVYIVLSNDLLGLGVGFLDAQSNEELASVELGGEGSLRAVHHFNGLVVVLVVDPLGVGTHKGIFGDVLCKLEVLVELVAGLDSTSNGQVQLTAEGPDAVLVLGRLPVRGLSFLCVLDSVSLQGVQKDLSSFLTGEVSFGLPAVSQTVDEVELTSQSQNVDSPGRADKAFCFLIVAQGDQSHLQELGAGDVRGGSEGVGVHAGDDASAIAVTNIGLAPAALFIGKRVDGGVVGADVGVLVVKDRDQLRSLFTGDGCSRPEFPIGVALHGFDEIKNLDSLCVIGRDLVGVLVLSCASHGCQTQQGSQNQNQRKNLFKVLH